MATALTEPKLLGAEEYGQRPDDGQWTELVRGKVVETSLPYTTHGYLMNRVGVLLTLFVEKADLGRVVSGDAGVITERNPDTVRGPDVAFYSYNRIPRGALPDGYWPASPEVVFEIRSASDSWRDLVRKVGEYFGADVLVVAILDPATKRVHLFSVDRETTVLGAGDRLTIPGVLDGFEVEVGRLFE
jgi:Uma2 family endonuclease